MTPDDGTIRVACIADPHYDGSPGGRLGECVRIGLWIVDDLKRRNPDVILIAGDMFERKSGPDERNRAIGWVRRLAAIAPVVIVGGNHDAPGDLDVFGKLDTEHIVCVAERPMVYWAKPTPVAVACLPWPRKAHLLAALGGDVSPEHSSAIAAECLRDVLRGLGGQVEAERTGGPVILLAHAMVSGSVTSTGQPLVGCDMELGLADLDLVTADLVVLGHIHKAQQWRFGDVPILYPGSPRRTAYGEVEAKGYVFATFVRDDGRRTGWRAVPRFVETPCQPMILIERWWRGGIFVSEHGAQFDENDCPDVTEADVRFRYRVDAPDREAARLAAGETERWLRDAGADRVKVEEIVRPHVVARAPEVAQAKTLPDKLDALWRARGKRPDDETRARLFDKLAELESECD